MAPVLYMTPLSPPSRGVLITAEALDLKLELKNVDLSKGENRRPEYLKLNPLHSVPTIVDGEVIITDSHAINAYLVQKYAKSDDLYPKELAKRALVDQRLYFDTGILFNLFRNTVAPLFYQKSKEVPKEDANKVTEGYRFLETFLENSQWIAGDKVTIADISIVTTVTALDILVPLDASHFPKIVAWVCKFKELPWARVNEPGLNELRDVVRRCMA